MDKDQCRMIIYLPNACRVEIAPVDSEDPNAPEGAYYVIKKYVQDDRGKPEVYIGRQGLLLPIDTQQSLRDNAEIWSW